MRVQKVATISICAAVMAFSQSSRAQQKSAEEFFRRNSGESIQLAQNSGSDEDPLTRALRQKQAELDAQEATATTKSTATKSETKSQPMVRVRPAAVPKAVPQTPIIPAQPAANPSVDDKLIQALNQKQAELDAQEAATARAAATPKTAGELKAEAKERAESEKRIKRIEAEIKAKDEAIQKKMATQPKTSPKTQVAQRPAANKVAPTTVPEANSKEARLDELLRKYKADEITPHEYHMQRAKIVAEP